MSHTVPAHKPITFDIYIAIYCNLCDKLLTKQKLILHLYRTARLWQTRSWLRSSSLKQVYPILISVLLITFDHYTSSSTPGPVAHTCEEQLRSSPRTVTIWVAVSGCATTCTYFAHKTIVPDTCRLFIPSHHHHLLQQTNPP